jgi:hypothetical protein
MRMPYQSPKLLKYRALVLNIYCAEYFTKFFLWAGGEKAGDRDGRPYNMVLTLTLNIPTALKGWVGHAPQGRGALHIIIL